MKIAIVGAGNVGAMTASRIIDADLADVVLVDIVEGLAKGKALDIADSAPITGSSAKITGSGHLEDIKGADIVVITAGFARKPGMSRDDLLKKNSAIVRDIAFQVKRLCPSSIVIVVTNPLDVMSYIVLRITGFKPRRVMGMAGVLDSARFANVANFSAGKEVFMLGSHGDSMVPINRSLNLAEQDFDKYKEAAKNRGAEIISYLETGSAYFAPSAAVFSMIKSILKNDNKTMCCSAYLNGEYGEKDIYIGVPCVLGASGIEEIVEIDITPSEKQAFKKSVAEVRESIEKLDVL